MFFTETVPTKLPISKQDQVQDSANSAFSILFRHHLRFFAMIVQCNNIIYALYGGIGPFICMNFIWCRHYLSLTISKALTQNGLIIMLLYTFVGISMTQSEVPVRVSIAVQRTHVAHFLKIDVREDQLVVTRVDHRRSIRTGEDIYCGKRLESAQNRGLCAKGDFLSVTEET